MKPALIALALAVLFISSLAFSSAQLQKAHKGLDRDGAKINCAYCHEKAAIPKEGKDYQKHQGNPGCKGSGCH